MTSFGVEVKDELDIPTKTVLRFSDVDKMSNDSLVRKHLSRIPLMMLCHTIHYDNTLHIPLPRGSAKYFTNSMAHSCNVSAQLLLIIGRRILPFRYHAESCW